MHAETGFEVRPLERADLDAVVAIETQSFTDPWPHSAFASEVGTTSAPRVAVAGGQVLGYICWMLGPGEINITNIAVHPDFRRSGIGRGLVEYLLNEAVGLGCYWVYLEVRPSNAAARELYARMGFVEIFRRRRYYIRPQEDALVLAYRIGPPAVADTGSDGRHRPES